MTRGRGWLALTAAAVVILAAMVAHVPPVGAVSTATTASVWTMLPHMASPRGEAPTATLLDAPACHTPGTSTTYPCGQVLVTGGRTPLGDARAPSGQTSSAELFDPASGAWRSAAPMTEPRQQHTATLLENGDVLVAGGQVASRSSTVGGSDTAAIFHPRGPAVVPGTVGFWTPAAPMNSTEWRHTATRLDGPSCRHTPRPSYCGQVLVVGVIADLYDPGSGIWTEVGTSGVGPPGVYPLSSIHLDGTASLLDGPPCHGSRPPRYCGNVLVVGGDPNSPTAGVLGSAQSVDQFDPRALGTNGSPWITTDSLSEGRVQHTATVLPDGSVLIAGGVDPTSAAGSSDPRKTWRFDPEAQTWLDAGLLSRKRIGATATLVPTGDVLMVGGGLDSGPTRTMEVYHPAPAGSDASGAVRGTWSPATPQLNAARSRHTATLIPPGPPSWCGRRCGSLLVTGGDDPSPLDSAELFGPLLSVACTQPVSCQGLTTGGTPVVLTGRGFTGAASVTFDGSPPLACGAGPPAPCWQDDTDPDTILHAVSPPHAAGQVHVTVTVDTDTGATVRSDMTPADLFTYIRPDRIPPEAPTVAFVSPTCGRTAGGEAVTIIGTNLAGATTVSFGSTPSASFSAAPSGTTIRAITPAEKAGPVTVTVIAGGRASVATPGSVYTFSDRCTFVTPSVTPTPTPTPPPANPSPVPVPSLLTSSLHGAPPQPGNPGGGVLPPTAPPPGPPQGRVPVGVEQISAGLAILGSETGGVAFAGAPRLRAAPVIQRAHLMVGRDPCGPGPVTGVVVVTAAGLGCAMRNRRIQTLCARHRPRPCWSG